MSSTRSQTSEYLLELIETVHRLRAPEGCPWDRAQTHQSLRPYLIEEAYEVLDILDKIDSSESLRSEQLKKAFCEELGDLLMQVLLHSEMTDEAGVFSISDVAKQLNEKLIRRHPHVFGDKKAESADIALQRWEKEKAKKKGLRMDASILDGVPRGLPALQKAARLIEKVTKVGFQWEDLTGPIEKIEEELSELKAEIQKLEKLKARPDYSENNLEEIKVREFIGAELGDFFFTLCNIAYLLKISPEDSLRKTNARFEKRFRYVERRLKEEGKTPEQSDLTEMDLYWDEAKKFEKVEVWGLTGGTGSGKSSAGRYFMEIGIPVIDADEIARKLLNEDSTVSEAVLKRFGTTDRNQLRELVFSDTQARLDLEAILHPKIQAESRKRILEHSSSHPVVIYEAALLIETGRHKDLSGLIVVEAPREARIRRIISSRNLSEAIAQKIVDSQIPEQDRRKFADIIIDNSESLDHLRSEVLRISKDKHWNSE